MAVKKTELYSSLWASCDELRGGMDASQYKDYVLTQQLANRVKTLEERYAEPLPQLVQEVEALASKVDEHLRKMGLEWGA